MGRDELMSAASPLRSTLTSHSTLASSAMNATSPAYRPCKQASQQNQTSGLAVHRTASPFASLWHAPDPMLILLPVYQGPTGHP